MREKCKKFIKNYDKMLQKCVKIDLKYEKNSLTLKIV